MPAGQRPKACDELIDARLVVRCPARQREQVVGQVAAAGRDQGERLVHVRELAWPGVGEDQVSAVLPGDGGGEPVAAVGDHPLDARVGNLLPRYARQRLRQFDGDERDAAFMPASRDAVPRPVPVPSSRMAPPGLAAARR